VQRCSPDRDSEQDRVPVGRQQLTEPRGCQMNDDQSWRDEAWGGRGVEGRKGGGKGGRGEALEISSPPSVPSLALPTPPSPSLSLPPPLTPHSNSIAHNHTRAR
jgi:hypothetical protein